MLLPLLTETKHNELLFTNRSTSRAASEEGLSGLAISLVNIISVENSGVGVFEGRWEIVSQLGRNTWSDIWLWLGSRIC